MAQKLIERPATYASPTILARRARILDLTRELIAERGYAGFSLKEIGVRAGVAKQTLYNIFQTKERMIATAINQYFKDNEDSIHYASQPGTMDRMIERTIVAGKRSQRVPNYMSALMAIYHSPDADPDIWEVIHRVGTYPHLLWIEDLARRKLLQSWIEPKALIDDVGAYRYLIVLEWCRGGISDEEALRRKVIGSLSMMVGATIDPVRGEIEAKLRDIVAKGVPSYPAAPELPASQVMRERSPPKRRASGEEA
jgi:AcrR family transcriptional regulator